MAKLLQGSIDQSLGVVVGTFHQKGVGGLILVSTHCTNEMMFYSWQYVRIYPPRTVVWEMVQ